MLLLLCGLLVLLLLMVQALLQLLIEPRVLRVTKAQIPEAWLRVWRAIQISVTGGQLHKRLANLLAGRLICASTCCEVRRNRLDGSSWAVFLESKPQLSRCAVAIW